jgi:hypothetical protein
MPEELTLALTYADTRDFLRGVSVTTYTGAQADELIRDVFENRQAQQAAFVALADCGLELVPLAS